MSEATRAHRTSARLRGVVVASLLVVGALTAGRVAADSLATDQIGALARGVAASPSTEPSDPGALPPLFDGPVRPAEEVLPGSEVGTHRTWFAAGTWWAILPEPTTGAHRIWALAGPDGPWVDVGPIVDERPFARVQVAWDGEDLVVASSGNRDYRGHSLRIHRFSWDPDDRTWEPAPDHPIDITDGGETEARLAVTPDGTAWLVRPRGSTLEVTHTVGRAARMTPWAPIEVPGGAADVGGFDLVVDGDDAVVVWRRTATAGLVVARRGPDGWDREEVAVAGIAGAGPVDAATGPEGGSLTALVTTTGDDGASGDQAPAALLVALPSPGRTAPPPPVAVVARAQDGLDNMALVVDGDRARVLAVVDPHDEEVRAWGARGQRAPTSLVVKEAPLDDPLFGPGEGRRLATGVDGAPLTRPLLPASDSSDAGLVVVVSGPRVARWTTWAEEAGVPAVAPAAPGDAGEVLVNDTFDALPLGTTAPTAWAPDDADPPVGEIVEGLAPDTRALRLVGGAEPLTVCRPIPQVGAQEVTVEAVVRAVGTPTEDARLLTLRGPPGSLASVRLSRLGLASWSTLEGRVSGQAVPPGAVLTVRVRMDVAARTADIDVISADGVTRAHAEAVPWLTEGATGVDELCVRPATGQATEVVVEGVQVTAR